MMNRLEYVEYMREQLQLWKEAIEYSYQVNRGLDRDINICIINLHFAGYEIKKDL